MVCGAYFGGFAFARQQVGLTANLFSSTQLQLSIDDNVENDDDDDQTLITTGGDFHLRL